MITRQAIAETGTDLRTTGILVHRLGDTYAHRQFGKGGKPYAGAESWVYSARVGHEHDAHAPDVIQRRPDLYLKYVDTLAVTLGEKRGMSTEQIAAIQEQLRQDLGQVAVEAPTSGKRGVLKPDSALEYEAQGELKKLLRRDLERRSEQGLEPTDLTYRPESSGPGYVFGTTTEDLAIALIVDRGRRQPSGYWRAPQRKQFAAETWAEMEQIEPSAERALELIERKREARKIAEGKKAAVIVETASGKAGVKIEE